MKTIDLKDKINSKPKIVIIGGGFGGINVAKYLFKYLKGKAEIILISKKSYFLFTPLLHEVATGSLCTECIIQTYDEIFQKTNIKYIENSVVGIDTNRKIVKT